MAEEEEKKKIFLSTHSSLFGKAFKQRFSAPEFASTHEILPEKAYKDAAEFRASLVMSDIIVLDLFDASLSKNAANLVTALIKVVVKLKDKDRRIIGLSHTSTWAQTPFALIPPPEPTEPVAVAPAEGTEENPAPVVEPPPPQYAPWSESGFASRISAATSTAKDLHSSEGLLLSLSEKNECLLPTVVCAGTLYGLEGGLFASLFQQAWMCDEPVQCTASTHRLCTLHVTDCVKIVNHVIALDKEKIKPYLVAIDQSKHSIVEIAQAIAAALSSQPVAPTSRESLGFDQIAWDYLGAQDCAFDLSSCWLHEKDDEENDKIKLEWTAKQGLAAAIKTCVDEYIVAHHLHPLRVFVHGGPCVGKSTLCELLSSEHYLPHLKLETMVEAALGGKDDFAVELEKALVPNPDKKNKKKDRRLPLPQLIQVVQKQLQQPLCRNKGYVLDGFPRTLEEARALFVCEPPKVEGDDAAAPAATGPVFQSFAPTHCIDLQLGAEAAFLRAQAIRPEHVLQFHNDAEGAQRRWERFTEQSTQQNAPALCLTYVTCCSLDAESATTDLVERANAYVASADRHNFHPTPAELTERERQRAIAEVQQQAKAAASQREQEQRDAAERETRAQENSARLEHLLLDESALMESRAAPLRAYLASTVVQALTEGMLEVCRVAPSDPVDYLAEFLFKYAEHAKTQAAATPAFAPERMTPRAQ